MSGKTALLLGLGMQGKAALYDLVRSGEVAHVVVADNRDDLAEGLARYPAATVSARRLDVGDDAAVAALMGEADVVVEALPGHLALRMGRLAAECGRSLVSSMYYRDPAEEDPERIARTRAEIEALDRRANQRGVVILTEFGLDPGLDLILSVKAISQLDEVHGYVSYGAGLPAAPSCGNPLRYKFSWSPMGVMRSYRRPARIVRCGAPLRIAADEVFESRHGHTLWVGQLAESFECFPNGDAVHYADLLGIREGLREAGRYTCRRPGHCAFWDTMVKCGFLDASPVTVQGAAVSPMEFTATLLAGQRQFQYGADEADLTLVRVEVWGIGRGKASRVAYQLIDRRDPVSGFTSMQRTVGFTLGLGARLILRGKLAPGLLTPLDVPYEKVIPALEEHGIRVSAQSVIE